MKQSLRQQQKLSIKITPNLGNQIKLLSLNGFEISSKLNKLVEKYLDEDDKKVIEVFAFMTSVALERLRGGESAGHESMTQ